MNTYKTQFLALEAKVKHLTDVICKLEGTTPTSGDCHYASFERESGEIALDCMDTFRFIYSLPPNQMPNYLPNTGHQNLFHLG